MSMNDPSKADANKLAAKLRRGRIAVMRVCKCAWPVVAYRNGSGHHNDCPAHAAWKALTEDERG